MSDAPPSPGVSPGPGWQPVVQSDQQRPTYDEAMADRDRKPSTDSMQTANGGAEHEQAQAATLAEKVSRLFEEARQDLEVVEEAEIRWEIQSWAELRKENKRMSEPVSCGGKDWRILVFPNGNNSDRLAVYLQLDWPDKQKNDAVCADFVLALANPENDRISHAQYSFHRFGEVEMDWGFGAFFPLSQLTVPTNPLLHNDKTTLYVRMRVLRDETGVLFHTFKDYNSKEKTGFVGLKNQGATCYMNSILQSLFCTNYFRKAVYQIPTPTDAKEGERSVTVSLQRLFYFMQTSNDAVETNELTKSFGWNTVDAFAQHDVQEFLRVLTDNLEEKMKGTPADGMIQQLFVGKMKSFVKCVNVDYESSRIEDFYDIQLNVKGMTNVIESFKDYIQSEMLEGDNKYMAEGHGLQDAKKGVIFTKFPAVLHLQLKRFEYDFMHDAMVKINDRYEFPLTLQLDEFLEEPDEVKQTYHLHGVLVHSGSLDGGHYCAFIRPTRDPKKWYKFDDDKVIPVTLKEVMEDNFGGEIPPSALKMQRFSRPAFQKRFTNAYMLVYVRESDYDQALCSITDKDVPSAIRMQLEKERLEKEQRDRELREREFMLTVRVIDDKTIKDYGDFDLWSFTPSSVEWTSRFNKHETTFRMVQEKYAEHLGKKPEEIRFWGLTTRENKTVRPDQDNLISETDMDSTLEVVRARMAFTQGLNYELKLYCEVPRRPYSDDKLFPPSPSIRAGYKPPTAMVFIKCFDVKAQTLWIAGHLHVDRSAPMKDSVPSICEMICVAPGTKLKMYEEIHREMYSPCKVKNTWKDEEIVDGDIITVQVDDDALAATLPPGASKTAPDHYAFLHNKIDVVFKPKQRDNADLKQVPMTLSKKMPYDMVAARVAHALGVDDPFKIRFFSTFANDQPRGPVRPGPATVLEDMLGGFYGYRPVVSDTPLPQTILYEILEMSLKDLESKRAMQISTILPGKEDSVDVLVPKAALVADVAAAIGEKIGLPNADRALRIYEAMGGKISREFSGNDPMSMVPEYVRFVAQQLPDLADASARLIQCVHMNQNPAQLHGTPFKFPILPQEPFAETKKRLQAYLGWSDKEMTKVTFRMIPLGAFTENLAPELADDQVLMKMMISHGIKGMGPLVEGDQKADQDSEMRVDEAEKEAETNADKMDMDSQPPALENGPRPSTLSTSFSLALDHPVRRQSRIVSSFERAVRIFN